MCVLEKALVRSLRDTEIATASKTVLLKYQEHRRKVIIPAEKDTSDLSFLESSFRKIFNFEKQVNLSISFQRYDADFDELVDLEYGDDIKHLEKLNVVVTPVLITPSAVSVRHRSSKYHLPLTELDPELYMWGYTESAVRG